MSVDAIRQMLRCSGVRLSILTGTSESLRFPDTPSPALLEQLSPTSPTPWSTGPHERRIAEGLEPFRGHEDVLRWADIGIRQRLSRAFGPAFAGQGKEWLTAEALLRGALIECLLTEFLPEQTTLPTLRRQYDSLREHLDPDGDDTRRELDSHYASGNIRRTILALSPSVTGLDGRDLLARLCLKFPERPVSVSPEWVRRFQRPDRPSQFWLYHGMQGTGLFLVLFSKSCRHGSCLGCNLFRLGAKDPIGPIELTEQVRTCLLQELNAEELSSVRELVLSNNGSMLDSRTLPTSALLYACVLAVSRLPRLTRIVLETRADFVTPETLDLVRQTLDSTGRTIDLELALGVEIFDETLRNRSYRKGLSNVDLERAIENAARISASFRCYFMYRPLPGMTREVAREDITSAVGFLDDLSERHGVPITLHLNPTFVAAETELEKAFQRGEFEPVDLAEIEELLAGLSPRRVTLYVGLNDEGLAVPGGSFLKPGSDAVLARLKRFNRGQDFGPIRSATA